MTAEHSYLHTGLLIGEDGAVRCNTYPSALPILVVECGPNALNISVKSGLAAHRAAVFARALARAAEDFAAEIERMQAQRDAAGLTLARDLAA